MRRSEAERADLVAGYARLMERPEARDEGANRWATCALGSAAYQGEVVHLIVSEQLSR